MFGNDLKVNKKKLQVKAARKSEKRKAAEKKSDPAERLFGKEDYIDAKQFHSV